MGFYLLQPVSFLMLYMLHVIDKRREACDQLIALVRNAKPSYLIRLLSVAVYWGYRYLKDVSLFLYSFVACKR
jgi:hypothetical protein